MSGPTGEQSRHTTSADAQSTGTAEFVDLLFPPGTPGAVAVWRSYAGGRKTTTFYGDGPGMVARKQLAFDVADVEANDKPIGQYVRMTTVQADSVTYLMANGKRGEAEDSDHLFGFWSDLDIAAPGHKHQTCNGGEACTHRGQGGRALHASRVLPLPPDEPAARAVIDASGLPRPTVVVHSGGGLYAYWVMEAPIPIGYEQGTAFSKRWQNALKAGAASLGYEYGSAVHDLARVLRLPGTTNRKPEYGPDGRPCRVLSADGPRYTPEQIVAVLRELPEQEAVQEQHNVQAGVRHDRPGDDYDANASWDDVLLPHGWTKHGSQHADGTQQWQKPGGSSDGGCSATTGSPTTGGKLFVFSTDAAPFEAQRPYGKFAAYTLLNGFGVDFKAAARALRERGYGADKPRAISTPGGFMPAVKPRVDVEQAAVASDRGDLDVSEGAGEMAYWLEDQLGRGALAGYFLRSGALVHTASEGEDGYVPPSGEDDHDGPSQIRAIGHKQLAGRLQYTFNVFRMVASKEEGGEPERRAAVFPPQAAEAAVNAADMLPHLRTLRGVVHTPVLRRDGSILSTPGYDDRTRLLYLPTPGLEVPTIADEPSGEDVAAAVQLLREMTAGFPWQDEKLHFPNYLGYLLTPVMRELFPPPYKMFAMNAHQPGSGKTLLANLGRVIHGGVFRSEFPAEDTELKKAVTSIFAVTTAPVVIFDNCSGTLRSSALAGLLTGREWSDRILGKTEERTFPNDRVWTITGNNLALGGDLIRRTINVAIDPGRPNPEKRTGFAIADLEGWTEANRGRLIAALLTLVRAWIVAGRPTPARAQTDGYAAWEAAVGGILAHAGVPGEFDADESRGQEQGDEDTEWGVFLAKLHEIFGEGEWRAPEVLAKVQTMTTYGQIAATDPRPIPIEVLPDQMTSARAGQPAAVPSVKSFGKWLGNRVGRWSGDLTIRKVRKDRDGMLWRIERYAKS